MSTVFQDPASDSTPMQWTPQGGPASVYDCMDKGGHGAGTPDTTTFGQGAVTGEEGNLGLTDPALSASDSVSQVTIGAYCETTGSASLQGRLIIDGTPTAYHDFGAVAGAQWVSHAFSVSTTGDKLTTMTLEWKITKPTTGFAKVYDAYTLATYISKRIVFSPEYEGETPWQRSVRDWPFVIVGGERQAANEALAHFAAPEGGTLCGADITGRIPTSNPHDVTCPKCTTLLSEGTAVRTRAAAQKIVTGCPSCGHQTLFISEQGHLTCSWLQCREPGVEHAIESLKRGDDILDRIAQLPRRTIEFSGFALSDPPIKYDAVLLNDIGTLQKVD